MLKKGLTADDLDEITGINKGYISQMKRGDRPMPKYAIFVFSLCLKLNKDEVRDFLKIAGKALGDDVDDNIFKMFLELDDNDPKRYDVEEFVATCLTVAENSGRKLPNYYYGGKKAKDN